MTGKMSFVLDDFKLNEEQNDLNKLAFWNATGSGKTLLMHVNIKQYLHYIERHNVTKNLNRIIVLTPNENLSRQHLIAFKASGMEAELFSKASSGNSTLRFKAIEIIDINKLSDRSTGDKNKSVAFGSFEENNLVLVDEGHRGSTGEIWQKYRAALSKKGFSFEYSATFGQAVSSQSGKKQEELLNDYGNNGS